MIVIAISYINTKVAKIKLDVRLTACWIFWEMHHESRDLDKSRCCFCSWSSRHLYSCHCYDLLRWMKSVDLDSTKNTMTLR